MNLSIKVIYFFRDSVIILFKISFISEYDLSFASANSTQESDSTLNLSISLSSV